MQGRKSSQTGFRNKKGRNLLVQYLSSASPQSHEFRRWCSKPWLAVGKQGRGRARCTPERALGRHPAGEVWKSQWIRTLSHKEARAGNAQQLSPSLAEDRSGTNSSLALQLVLHMHISAGDFHEDQGLRARNQQCLPHLVHKRAEHLDEGPQGSLPIPSLPQCCDSASPRAQTWPQVRPVSSQIPTTPGGKSWPCFPGEVTEGGFLVQMWLCLPYPIALAPGVLPALARPPRAQT